ncbi:hypothetical protein GC175_28830 [bacterium]|nr:hypothetical protein [bacterium]
MAIGGSSTKPKLPSLLRLVHTDKSVLPSETDRREVDTRGNSLSTNFASIHSFSAESEVNMTSIVKFDLDEGDSILVEIDEPVKGQRTSGMVPASPNAADVVEKAKVSFDAALDKIRPIATTAISKIRQISDPPDEVEIEFNLKMSAEAGVVLSSVAGEAQFVVKMKWKKEEKKSEGKESVPNSNPPS